MNGNRAIGWSLACVLACAAACPDAAHAAATADSTVLRGDREGTVFRTLTVEGEDRVHLEIGRPGLRLDLDPSTAPGLDLGGTRDVLDRTRPDMIGPLFAGVAAAPSPYTGRPWLDEMATGPVARFRPELTDVTSWSLVVTDSRGRATTTFEGRGKPPGEIAWDGRGVEGSLALPGITYSYVLEARDRAGNRRHFMGDGFEVPAYRRDGGHGPMMVLPGAAVDPRASGVPGGTPPALLEAASWLNQADPTLPVEITVVARTQERAAALARTVRGRLEPNLVGDTARIRERLVVDAEAPEGDDVVIRTLAR